MPIDNGQATNGYSPTNKGFQTEINDWIEKKVKAIDEIRDDKDNIIKASTNFHYDSKELTNGTYKFDVQYKKGKGDYSGKTVAVVKVRASAEDVDEFYQAVAQALKSKRIYTIS